MRRRRIVNHVLAATLVLALTSLYAGSIPVAHAATVVVNTTHDELNHDGDCSLREAVQAANIDAAVDGCTAGSGADTISLPPGFYTLTIPGTDEDDNATGDLDIKGDLTVVGQSGAGNTIIQAGTTSTNGIDRVLDVHWSVSYGVQINGVTIRFGRTPNLPAHDGGGIRNYGALTLNNSTVTGNAAPASLGRGGGIYNRSIGTLTLNDSTVSNNTAGRDGGGIYNAGVGADLTLDSSVVSHNTAQGSGGGIYNHSGTVRLDDSTVADNDADSDHDLSGNGGGISNHGTTTVELNRSTVANNSATYGGGIYNQGDSTLILSRSTIGDNDCAFSGGGIYNDNPVAMLILHMSTVEGNDTGRGDGGGIYNGAGDLSLDKCTVSGNGSGDSGGGIYTAGSLSLDYTTIAKNRADFDGDGAGDGGGIRVGGGVADARNTIIGDNSDRWPEAPDCSGRLTSLGYNLIEDTSGCTVASATGDLFGFAPKIGALGDNGGPTWTHALIGGSAAIEWIPAGASGCQAGVSVDQRGYRRAGGAGYGGSRCDIGAYEYDTGPRQVYLPLVLR
ncbi:MAG: choice-of-anchor Q domain-containing protein [Anaerolineae bacterium]|jgi:CSLREA domain-containing protein